MYFSKRHLLLLDIKFVLSILNYYLVSQSFDLELFNKFDNDNVVYVMYIFS